MKMSTRLAVALVPACVLALSACGGGGGGEDEGGISFRAADVSGGSAILATGGSPPDVSSAQAKSQQLAILYGANIGHWSTTTEVDWEGRVQRGGGGREEIYCDPIECDHGDTAFDPIMIGNGVRLAQTTDRESLGDGGVTTALGYGGWMEHSLFAVWLEIDTYDGGSFVNWVRAYSLALGDAPGTNPGSGALSWDGVMVGRNSDIDSASVSNVVQGRRQCFRSAVSGGRHVGRHCVLEHQGPEQRHIDRGHELDGPFGRWRFLRERHDRGQLLRTRARGGRGGVRKERCTRGFRSPPLEARPGRSRLPPRSMAPAMSLNSMNFARPGGEGARVAKCDAAIAGRSASVLLCISRGAMSRNIRGIESVFQ